MIGTQHLPSTPPLQKVNIPEPALVEGKGGFQYFNNRSEKKRNLLIRVAAALISHSIIPLLSTSYSTSYGDQVSICPSSMSYFLVPVFTNKEPNSFSSSFLSFQPLEEKGLKL
ncbi:hypothetical protein HAX54_022713 [Datura stramonium]|uniref:Uncharacterized protein n=1 Tax=Datura stramonium TaxID=4076 RepID=A0ABS8UX41_DATST|nr:hypothetical protein [Datura stramonium]